MRAACQAMSGDELHGRWTDMSKRRNRRVARVTAESVAVQPPTAQTRSWRRWLGLSLVLAGMGVVWILVRDGAPPTSGFQVVRVFPHDAQAYTQGLVFADGVLYESTGKFGQSTLRKVQLETGKVLDSRALDRSLFGEGLTLWGDRLIQLTWKNKVGIVYDRQTLQELHQFPYAGEGWGLTHDGTHLIMSDGSATLTFLDPQTYQVVRRLLVRSQGRRVDQLNELEFVRGEVWANIWYKDYLARISPRTGEVTGWIDLRDLYPKRPDRDAVLNGIAYDPERGRLFVTGKYWPKLYEIRLTTR